MCTFSRISDWKSANLGSNLIRPEKLRPLAQTLLVAIVSVLAGSAWLHSILEVVHDYSPLPWGDYWRVPQNLAEYRALNLGVLWRQHSEHRIIFPEIVFAADMLIARGCQVLPLVASVLCYFATWVLMSWVVLREVKTPLAGRMMTTCLAAFIIGWPGSSAVLSWAFLLNWTVVQLAALVGLFSLARAAEGPMGDLYLLCSISAAVVATFSSGNGLVLWPVLVLSGLALSLRLRQMMLLVLAAVASISAFFFRYQFLGDASLTKLVRHPLYFLGFVASYMSMPFGAIKFGARLGLYVGTGYFIIVISLAVYVLRARAFSCTPFVTLFGFCVFTVFGAALTAVGRMDLRDRIFFAAKPPRYVTLPILSWAALVLLLLWLSGRFAWKTLSVAKITVFLTILLVLVLPKLRRWVRSVEGDFAEVQWAELSIESGLADPGMIHKIFPDAEFVTTHLSALRPGRLSIFSYDFDRLLGQPAAKRFVLKAAESYPGDVNRTFPILSGLEISGWTAGPSSRIVVVDNAGRIAGFGRKLPAGFPRELAPTKLLERSGWVGFANLRFGSESFSAYAVGADGRTLIPIGMPFKAPPIQAAIIEDVGLPIPGVGWEMDRTWTENMIPPRVDPGVLPSKRFFASWSGGDINTGQIKSRDFDVPANGCMILPVLHGPSVGGLSARITDATTADRIAYVPLQDADTQWRLWRVTLKPNIRRVRIEAQDAGPWWGQWLGIGEPAQCK